MCCVVAKCCIESDTAFGVGRVHIYAKDVLLLFGH